MSCPTATPPALAARRSKRCGSPGRAASGRATGRGPGAGGQQALAGDDVGFASSGEALRMQSTREGQPHANPNPWPPAPASAPCPRPLIGIIGITRQLARAAVLYSWRDAYRLILIKGKAPVMDSFPDFVLIRRGCSYVRSYGCARHF